VSKLTPLIFFLEHPQKQIKGFSFSRQVRLNKHGEANVDLNNTNQPKPKPNSHNKAELQRVVV
jgi:hypothetical protein